MQFTNWFIPEFNSKHLDIETCISVTHFNATKRQLRRFIGPSETRVPNTDAMTCRRSHPARSAADVIIHRDVHPHRRAHEIWAVRSIYKRLCWFWNKCLWENWGVLGESITVVVCLLWISTFLLMFRYWSSSWYLMVSVTEFYWFSLSYVFKITIFVSFASYWTGRDFHFDSHNL